MGSRAGSTEPSNHSRSSHGIVLVVSDGLDKAGIVVEPRVADPLVYRVHGQEAIRRWLEVRRDLITPKVLTAPPRYILGLDHAGHSRVDFAHLCVRGGGEHCAGLDHRLMVSR